MLVSHWFELWSAVVSEALVYRRLTNTSEILVGRVSGDAPESGRNSCWSRQVLRPQFIQKSVASSGAVKTSVCRKNLHPSERSRKHITSIEASHQTDILQAVISAALAHYKHARASGRKAVYSTNFGMSTR
jgi:hypothetical protein